MKNKLIILFLTFILSGCATFKLPSHPYSSDPYESEQTFALCMRYNYDSYIKEAVFFGPIFYERAPGRECEWRLKLVGDGQKNEISDLYLLVNVERYNWGFYREYCFKEGRLMRIPKTDRDVLKGYNSVRVSEQLHIPVPYPILFLNQEGLDIRIYGDDDTFDLHIPGAYITMFLDVTVQRNSLSTANMMLTDVHSRFFSAREGSLLPEDNAPPSRVNITRGAD